jgi:hypothetical protein
MQGRGHVMAKKPTDQPGMSRDEIEELVTTIVRRELATLVASIEARAMERHKGTGSRVVKKTVSIPVDVWAQLRRECPGPASSHVTAAIRLYLATRKGDTS